MRCVHSVGRMVWTSWWPTVPLPNGLENLRLNVTQDAAPPAVTVKLGNAWYNCFVLFGFGEKNIRLYYYFGFVYIIILECFYIAMLSTDRVSWHMWHPLWVTGDELGRCLWSNQTKEQPHLTWSGRSSWYLTMVRWGRNQPCQWFQTIFWPPSATKPHITTSCNITTPKNTSEEPIHY